MLFFALFLMAYVSLGFLGVWMDRFIYTLIEDSPLANGGEHVGYKMSIHPYAVSMGALFILGAIYAQICKVLKPENP